MQLMEHQQDGVGWLLERPRAMLGWDMGVGKSATLLKAWDAVRADGPCLILCLCSARETWAREAHRWVPGARVQVIKHKIDKVDDTADIVITNYDKIAIQQFRDQLRRDWNVLVLDEAHALKTPGTIRTKRVYGGGAVRYPLINYAKRVWCGTGTPMPNHPGELWTHARYLWPELIKAPNGDPMTLEQWQLAYCQMVPTPYGNGFKIVGGRNLAELRARLSPVLHRLKRDSVLKLPKLTIDTWPLDAHEMPKKALPNLPELLGSLIAQYGPPDNIETFDNATLDTYLLAINQGVAPHATVRRETAQLKAVAVTLALQEELTEQKTGKTVIFAHHREAIETLSHGLRKFEPAVIHGGVSGDKRQSEIDRFNGDPRCRVFIGQTSAAGSSINLQAADNVVFVEASWVPGENDQAIGRVYRHGQESAVFVRFAYLPGSIDELVTRALTRKAQTISEAVG